MSENVKNEAEIGSAFELLGKSFELVKKNWIAFAVVNVLTLISALFPYKPEPVKNGQTNKFGDSFNNFSGVDLSAFMGVTAVLLIIVGVIALFLFTMMTILEVEASAGKKPGVSELFEKAKNNWLWLKLLGVMIISTVIIIAGFILLIIPGIIAIGRLLMTPYFLIDKNMGVMEAIKASNEMGKKYFWKVLAAFGVMILVTIAAGLLGAIPVIGGLIGAVITIAFSLVTALRYQQLKKLH